MRGMPGTLLVASPRTVRVAGIDQPLFVGLVQGFIRPDADAHVGGLPLHTRRRSGRVPVPPPVSGRDNPDRRSNRNRINIVGIIGQCG